jgi:hypothetical protein
MIQENKPLVHQGFFLDALQIILFRNAVNEGAFFGFPGERGADAASPHVREPDHGLAFIPTRTHHFE